MENSETERHAAAAGAGARQVRRARRSEIAGRGRRIREKAGRNREKAGERGRREPGGRREPAQGPGDPGPGGVWVWWAGRGLAVRLPHARALLAGCALHAEAGA